MTRRDQTVLGSQYALRALKDQRARFAGEIAELKSKLAWAQKQIRHLDAALHLMEPSLNPASIRPRRAQKRIKLFRQGDLGRHIVDAMRRAGKPMHASEIVDAVLARGEFGEEARPALGSRIKVNLYYQVRAGRIIKTGEGVKTMWALANG